METQQAFAPASPRTPVQLLPYDATVFISLNDFPLARNWLEEHRQTIEALGRVICQHGLQKEIGVSLLHRHFQIRETEVLVRNRQNGEAVTTPAEYTSVSSSIAPFLWKLATGRSGKGFYPLEFVRCSDKYETVSGQVSRIRAAADFLTKFAEALDAFGVSELFGIAALHATRGLVVRKGETLLENTDEKRRILSLRPVNKEVVAGADSTQTLWVFDAHYVPSGGFQGASLSTHYCIAHCIAHCICSTLEP